MDSPGEENGAMIGFRRGVDIEGTAGPAEVAVVGSEEEVESQLRRIAATGATDFLAGMFPVIDDAYISLRRTLLQGPVGVL